MIDASNVVISPTSWFTHYNFTLQFTTNIYFLLFYKDLDMGRWVLQWADQNPKDGAAHGSQCGGGLAAEEPAAPGALRVPLGRRNEPACKASLCSTFTRGPDRDGVVLPDVRLFLISSRCRVSPSNYFHALSLEKKKHWPFLKCEVELDFHFLTRIFHRLL